MPYLLRPFNSIADDGTFPYARRDGLLSPLHSMGLLPDT